MKHFKLLLALALFAVGGAPVQAQEDVTSKYIVNPGFENSTGVTGNVSNPQKCDIRDYAATGWKKITTGNPQYSAGAIFVYGSGSIMNLATPATDNNGEPGNCLGVAVGWGSTVLYQSADTVTLPAGTYTLSVHAYNADGSKTGFGSRLGFVPTKGTAFVSTKGSFASKTWVTDDVTFVLDAVTEGVFQIGGSTNGASSGSNGAANYAKVYFDNLTLTYTDPLAAAKNELSEAATSAEAFQDNIPTGAYTALKAIVDENNKEYSTIEEYRTAIAAINEAIGKATAIQAVFSNYKTVRDAVKALENQNVYTEGEEAKQTFDNTLAEQDAAIDAVADLDAVSDAIDNAKAEVRKAGGVFITSVTLNDGANFDLTNAYITNDTPTRNIDGWTRNSSKGSTPDAGNNVAEFWQAGGASISQVLPELPAGTYTLTAVALTRTGMKATLSADDATVDIATVGSGSVNDRGQANRWFNAGNGVNTLNFLLDEAKAVTVGLTADNTTGDHWLVWRNFKLTYNGPKATDEEVQAYKSALADAEAKTLGFDEGEYAPYNNVETINSLDDIKAFNPDIVNSSMLNAEKAKIDALTWTANTEEMNAFFDGSFQHEYNTSAGNVKPIGWHGNDGKDDAYDVRYMTDVKTNPGLAATSSGSAMMTKFDAYYGADKGYTIPLNANTTYRLTFKYSGWNDSGDKTTSIIITDANGSTYAINPTSFKGNGASGEKNVSDWDEYNGMFTTGEAGNYVVTFQKKDQGQQRQVVFGDFVLKIAVPDEVVLNEEETVAPANNVYANVTYDRTFAAGWNSVVLPFDVTFDELGAEAAYSFDGATDANGDGQYTINFTKVEDNTLKANTPYLVKVTTPNTEALKFNGKVVSPVEAPVTTGDAFSFVGTYSLLDQNNTTIVNGDYIVNAEGFAKAQGGNKVRAFRAYLDNANPAVNEAKAFNFGGDVVTGIEAAQLKSILTGKAYNLQGQQVTAPRHGVYVIGGKKVVVK